MLNSTPKKAVILSATENQTRHCIVCESEVSPQERLSIFGRSKLDLKGAISELIGGDLQVKQDQEHYICTKKCLSKIKKYLKLSLDISQLRDELKKQLTSRNSVQIKRGIADLSPIKPESLTTKSTSSTSCALSSKGAKKSLFTSHTVVTPLVVYSSVTPVEITASGPQLSLPAQPPLSLPAQQAVVNNKQTLHPQPSVQVILNYPGCEKSYKTLLDESLQPLGKALARRSSFQKIATAVFRSEGLKNCITKKILANLAKECINLCSKKNPSILRTKEPDDMMIFTLSKVCAEFKLRAPLFYSVLMTCATSDKNVKDWLPSIAVAGSVLLKERNVHMNGTQSLISLMVKQNGTQKLLNRLNIMKLSLSSKTTLRRLDRYGSKFKQEIKKMKGATTDENNSEESQSENSCQGNYKVVLDNIDLKILTRDMTADRQNRDIHWCNHIAVENRVVDDNGGMKQTDLLELDNSKVLPEVEDHQKLRKDYERLVSRVLVDHLPCFSFLKEVCQQHIPHRYSREMAIKSEKIPLGVIFKSENKAEEMKDILHQIQGYSTLRNNTSMPVIGDQVTIERGVNVIEALQNGYTSEERLDGVHMEIADWHSIVTFLRVIFNPHYSTSSDADKGTLFANRNLINRRNVVADVTSAWAPCKAFMLLDIKARIVAAAMKTLDMQKVEDKPKKFTISEQLENAPKIIKHLYLQKIAASIVDEFIINEDLQKKLVDSILSNKEKEDIINNQELTADGRFPCRFAGCNKSFRYDGKCRRKHELTHNPPPEVRELPSLTQELPAKKSSTEKCDDMFNYNCSVLNHGLLFMNFLDATAEGDGARLIRCWKFFLLHFKEEKSTYKYALEALYLQFQIHSLLSPEQAFNLIHNRTVNNRGGPGRNVSLDLDLEHENNFLKQGIKNLGPNVHPGPVTRICRAQKVTKTVLSNYDYECHIVRKSGKHTSADYSKDLKTIIDLLVKESVCTFTPGRQYSSFPNIKRDPLSEMNMSNVYGWINMHKKNIDLARKAR